MANSQIGNTPALVGRALHHAERTAIVDSHGRHTYQQLLDTSAGVASLLLSGKSDLDESRVAFLAPAGFDYTAVQWGIWRAGGVAVPLAVMHPRAELDYTIDDSQAAIVIAHPAFQQIVGPLAQKRGLPLISTTQFAAAQAGRLPQVDPSRRAMMLYTSGTTSRPKGVVTTHDNITAQICSLVEAWQWTSEDHIPLFLPLHHIHGIINVLGCALWSGATCEILPKFEPEAVWRLVETSQELTLLMAVPTIYARLIAAWQAADPDRQKSMSAGCRRLRLMVSGSAALPVSTLETWRGISGHTLLERYGMTEIGMGLSNPLCGERLPGRVGSPLPDVDVRLVDEKHRPVEEAQAGEIQVKGPTVFKEYWQRADATREAFTGDGYFKTGDIAQREGNIYQILGRNSVDIIKTGGYKVSALEIEEVLRTHTAIGQCAVVGVDDDHWGQRVAAAVVLHENETLDLDSLRAWSKERLAPYKIPTLLLTLDDLPRNAMGKVTKPAISELFICSN